MMADTKQHEWFIAQFSYASWTECACGYRPNSQKEMNKHAKENGMKKLR